MSTVSSVGALHAYLGLDTAQFTEGATRAQAMAQKLNNDLTKLETGSGKANKGFGATGNAMGKYAQSAGAARAANANLIAQFNDIGVMLAARQNPLQLAMQQGTQISQVLSQMGGGVGALKALGTAFVGMLNPISIATIGIIGFGAAAIQWLMPAKKEAEKTKTAFEQMADSIKGYQDALSMSLLYTGKAESEYGDEAKRGAEIARRVMEVEAKKTQESVKGILSKAYADLGFDAFGDNSISSRRAIDTNSASYAAEQMGFSGGGLLSFGNVSREEIAIANEYSKILREIYAFTNDPASMDGGLDVFQSQLADRLDAAQQLLTKAVEQGAAESVIMQHRQAINDLQLQSLAAAQQAALIKAAEESKAAEMLANMQHQLHIHELTTRYGKESLEVRQAEAQAEFEKQIAAIESLKITEDQKVALMDSAAEIHNARSQTMEWAYAQDTVNASLRAAASILASIGGGAINNAARAAGRAVMDAGGTAAQVRIAEEKARAEYTARQSLIKGDMGFRDYAKTLGQIDSTIADREAYKADFDALTAAEREAAKLAKGGGKKSGGGKAKLTDAQREAERDAKRQTDAYQTLQEQVGMLQAGLGKTALEQRILNEQQKIGSAASPEVVAALVRQQHALEQMNKSIENMRSSFVDAFTDIVTGAKSMADAVAGILRNLANHLAQQAGNSLFDAAMGAIMGSFGGGGRVVGGDALSSALRAIPGFAGGVTGYGGGLAMVGERGPELVNLPRGANVITNENTNKLLNGNRSNQSPQIHVSVDEGLKVQLLNDAARQSASITKSGIQQYSRSGLAADVKRLGGTRTMING